MTKETMEGRFNAQKVKILELLKSQGKFLSFCKERGYLYEIVGPIFGKDHRFIIGLKSGRVSVVEMQTL